MGNPYPALVSSMTTAASNDNSFQSQCCNCGICLSKKKTHLNSRWAKARNMPNKSTLIFIQVPSDWVTPYPPSITTKSCCLGAQYLTPSCSSLSTFGHHCKIAVAVCHAQMWMCVTVKVSRTGSLTDWAATAFSKTLMPLFRQSCSLKLCFVTETWIYLFF